MIFVNFKTYVESSGKTGLNLLNVLGEVQNTVSVPIIPVVQVLDIAFYSGRTLLPLWIQHIDPVTYGAHTGSVLPESAVSLQVKGTFLNHSEKPISLETIKSSVERAKEVNLKTLVFAKDVDTLKKIIMFKPDFVSYEPPELVGSTTTSVSSAKPEVISEAAEACEEANIPLIVGAGVHSTEDVRIAIERGAKGVAVATDIVKSNDPKSSLLKLLAGFS